MTDKTNSPHVGRKNQSDKCHVKIGDIVRRCTKGKVYNSASRFPWYLFSTEICLDGFLVSTGPGSVSSCKEGTESSLEVVDWDGDTERIGFQPSYG